MQLQWVDKSNIQLYQDNKSTILLENDDKMSSSKCTKTFQIQIFFINDKIGQGDCWESRETGHKKGRTKLSSAPNKTTDVV